MAKKAPPEYPLRRRIYFYEMRSVDPNQPLAKFDIARVCDAIHRLPDANRYLSRADGTALCVIPEPGSDNRLRFGKVRRDVLPPVEKRGSLRPLRLAEDEGLFECIHVGFFSDSIVGADFNLHAPRVSSLNEYIQEKVHGVPPIAFDMLLRQDMVRKLGKYSELRRLHMRIDTTRAAIAERVDESLGEAVRHLNNAGVGTFEFIIKGGMYDRRPLSERLWNAVKSIAREPELREGVDRLNVKAVDNEAHKVEELDLLEDRLVTTVEIPKAECRDADAFAEIVYQHIEQAHQSLASEIKTAVRAG